MANNVTSIIITKVDLFDGQIIYNSYCPYAFRQPSTGEVIDYGSGCNVKYADGSDIDSMEVYLYKSGKLNATVSNQKQVGSMILVTQTITGMLLSKML